MPDDSVFTLTLDPELRDAFLAAAEAAERPAPEIVRELMLDYVRREHDERGYDAFLARKVEIARASARAALGRSGAEVEAEFAALRAGAERA